MKKTWILGLAILLFAGLFFAACQANDKENVIDMPAFKGSQDDQGEDENGQGKGGQEPVVPDEPEVINGQDDETEAQSPGTFEGLSAETEQRILQDMLDVYHQAGETNITIDNLCLSGYYGNYHGYLVIRIYDSSKVHPDIVNPGYALSIAGVRIPFGYYGIPGAWKDGQFYTLQAVYDLGFLTVDDLLNLQDMLYNEDCL